MKAALVTNAAFIALLGATAVGTYALKHDVEATAQQLRGLKAQIAEERDNITILNAEWAHLNRPERLQELARRYLKLEPLRSEQIVPVGSVPEALERTSE